MRWLVGCFIGIVLLISVLVIYGVFIEPYQIEIHHVWIHDQDLGRILEKTTLVQLSDLHIEDIGKREQKILKILDNLKPDIIFLTGDYVKWNGNYEAALTFLSQLKAKIGIWGVMGDYDYSSSRKSCLFCHREGSSELTKNHQVHFLRDSTEMVHLPQGPIWISGIEKEEADPSSPLKSLQFLKNKKPVIILSHNPLSFDLFDKDHNIFMLAGDTHGGQVPLPSWFSGIIGYEKNASYSQGYFKKGNAKMYVSRGIGTSHIPIRLFRKPEIVVLHFSVN
ncbi:MAG: metallophosphoesterase [Thermodesulfovibrionales bacterium]